MEKVYSKNSCHLQIMRNISISLCFPPNRILYFMWWTFHPSHQVWCKILRQPKREKRKHFTLGRHLMRIDFIPRMKSKFEIDIYLVPHFHFWLRWRRKIQTETFGAAKHIFERISPSVHLTVLCTSKISDSDIQRLLARQSTDIRGSVCQPVWPSCAR